VPYNATTGTFAVVANASDCSWTATSGNSWISVSSGSPAAGNGNVGYSVNSSTSYLPKSGTISVNGIAFTIAQDAYPCTYSFYPASQTVPVGGGNFPLGVTTSCTWTASTAAKFIGLNAGFSGITGDGTLAYTVAPNTGNDPRTGTIEINDQAYAVNQSGNNCSFIVSPTSANFPAPGGQSQFVVETSAPCQWNVQNPATWVSLTIGGNPVTSASGTEFLVCNIAANDSPQSRTATLMLANQTVVITQAGLGIQFTSQSVLNGASFLVGPVAPGELISIFGSGLGPPQATGLQTTPDGGYVTTSLGGTQVLFDGMAAPLTYVSATQVNAIVPFELAGALSTQVVVEVQGIPSSPTTESVAPCSPAIFAVSGGSGQGAVLNQDNSANSSSNPATVGSVLQIFATGFGQTNPTGIDGQLAGTTASIPILSVTATVGGVNAPVQYVGSSNGLVAGVTQVNVIVPSSVQPGSAVPLVLNVGGTLSTTGLTVAIR
jgi:uncharacterized protein (TIGR03437 family)